MQQSDKSQDVGQARIRNAYDQAVQAAKGLPEDDKKKKYRSYVERLGPSILRMGLGQALAVEMGAASKSPEHKQLFENVEAWLVASSTAYEATAPNQSIIEKIVNGTQRQYLCLQEEALLWLRWHKEFVRALLPKPTGDEE